MAKERGGDRAEGRRREARSRQLIVWPVGEAERLSKSERDGEKKWKGERENNKVSLVGINLPHTAGMSVGDSW